MKKSRRRLLVLERLEDRCTPATWGNPWPDAGHLTLSFAPDGTSIGGHPSNLFQTLNAIAPTAVWQQEILRAFQTWAAQANINISVVADQGLPYGATGQIQGDSRFGDFRLAAYDLGSNVEAVAAPFNVTAGTSAGDVILNSSTSFGVNGSGSFDLYTVMLHEAGHVYGLDHSSDPASPMYKSYLGPRTGLSVGDVANIQALYGVRAPNTAGNNQLSTATALSGFLSATVQADITTLQDQDYYSFQTLLNASAVDVTVSTAGISLLTPSVTVFDSSGQMVATAAASDPQQGNVVIHLTNLQPMTTYYVQVGSGQENVFGIGGYQLTVDKLPSANTVAPSGSLQDLLARNDLHSNDTIATATPLSPASVPGGTPRYSVQASLSDFQDVDFYQVQAPAAPAGTDVVLTAMVWGVQNNLNPELRVFDAQGNAVPAEVLVNADGSFAVQVRQALTEATYYIEVMPAQPFGTQAVGDYFLAVDFPAQAEDLPNFTGGLLTDTESQVVNTLTVSQSQAFHFLLSSATTGPATGGNVQMTILDAGNNVVSTMPAGLDEPVSADVFLKAGTYTVVFSASIATGAPGYTYLLQGSTVTDPIGPDPIDPTGEPARGVSAGSGVTWTGSSSSGIAVYDPYSDPFTFLTFPAVPKGNAFGVAAGATLSVTASQGVLANDLDPNGGGLKAALTGTGPSDGILTLNSDGSFSYTPAPGFTGIDSFQYTAGDSLGSYVSTIWIDVHSADEPPVAGDVAFSTYHDQTLNLPSAAILGNSTDPNWDPLQAVVTAGPADGTLTQNPDGSFTYVPTAGFVGTDSFQFAASDGTEQSSSATVTINVNNAAPIASDESFYSLAGQLLTVPAPGLLDAAHDFSGAPLTLNVIGNVQHGNLTVNADGSFSYLPSPGFAGTDTFTYQVADGLAVSNVATVTLNVLPDVPVALDDGFSLKHDSAFTSPPSAILHDVVDPASLPLNVSLIATAQHGTLTLNPDGSFLYDPQAGFTGTDSFTYQAQNGLADSNVGTIYLDVTNLAPVAVNDSFQVASNQTLSVPAAAGVLSNDSDGDGDQLTASLVAGPTHGSLTLNNDGSFTYLPNTGYVGSDSFTYCASDSYAQSNLATVSLTISAPPPSVTGVSPAHGPAMGGTTVTVNGTNFLPGLTVTFGAVAASNVTVVSPTQLIATAPPQAPGTVDIIVQTAGGQSRPSPADQFHYVPAPTVTAVSPAYGPTSGGTTVTVSGNGFFGNVSVMFGNTPAVQVTLVSPSQLTAVAPAEAAGTVDVLVSAASGQSAPSTADRFTFVSGMHDLAGDTAALAYTPAQIRAAYGVNELSLDGTGQTIAIVAAFDNPAIYQAVDTFDAQFGLTTDGPTLLDQYGPAASFLTVLNQDGQASSLPATDPIGPGADNWEVEEALDVEWAHALAPGAHILLVESNSALLADLMHSVASAAAQPNVSVVSMSWGFTEGQTVLASDEACYDNLFAAPGVTFVASTGDYGAANPEYPAFSPNVLAVGGTSLYLNADNSYNSETGWGYFSTSAGTFIGTGGGLSLYEPEPSYQLGVQDTGYRSTPDVSLVADPATGAWIADPYNLPASAPFEVVGGTSLSAPSWAGLLALVNQGRLATGKAAFSYNDAQQALYSLPRTDFNSITSGNNNGFDAGLGYNMVTGLGSPKANVLVSDLINYNAPAATAASLVKLPAGLFPDSRMANAFSVLNYELGGDHTGLSRLKAGGQKDSDTEVALVPGSHLQVGPAAVLGVRPDALTARAVIGVKFPVAAGFSAQAVVSPPPAIVAIQRVNLTNVNGIEEEGSGNSELWPFRCPPLASLVGPTDLDFSIWAPQTPFVPRDVSTGESELQPAEHWPSTASDAVFQDSTEDGGQPWMENWDDEALLKLALILVGYGGVLALDRVGAGLPLDILPDTINT
jgi:hypothetical protein